MMDQMVDRLIIMLWLIPHYLHFGFNYKLWSSEKDRAREEGFGLFSFFMKYVVTLSSILKF